MLELHSQLISKIEVDVQSLKTVAGPGIFVGLKSIGALLPACIITPGGTEVITPRKNRNEGVEEQLWQITVITAYESDDCTAGEDIKIAGQIMQAIKDKVSDWLPDHPGFVMPMTYDGIAAPEYNQGYAEYPMYFKERHKI